MHRGLNTASEQYVPLRGSYRQSCIDCMRQWISGLLMRARDMNSAHAHLVSLTSKGFELPLLGTLADTRWLLIRVAKRVTHHLRNNDKADHWDGLHAVTGPHPSLPRQFPSLAQADRTQPLQCSLVVRLSRDWRLRHISLEYLSKYLQGEKSVLRK